MVYFERGVFLSKLSEFLNGDKNILRSFTDEGHEISIMRENTKNNTLFTITLDEIVIAQQWNPNKLSQKVKKTERKKSMSKICFQSGGQKSYLTVFDDWIDEISIESMGVLTKLFKNIRFNDGLLINRTTKLPILIDEISILLGKSRPFILKSFKELRNRNIIIKKNKGYYVSMDVIKRGNISKIKEEIT